MNTEISKEKIEKYFKITGEAIEMVKTHPMDVDRMDQANDFLDMATRYYSDAKHFFEKGDWVLAFGALNYAHGWLDAGARSGLFEVKDDRLFTVDVD
ncbi:MAG: DUF357 domain-containing protein [Nanoarchaeota archaeon]|nr:DUF357 domain-containing protein [Nanoarchaeota archaeon]